MPDGESAVRPVRAPAVPLARHYLLLVTIAAVVLAVDQATKALVRSHLEGGPVELPGGFVALEYARNTGAAFSLFPAGGPLLAALAAAISVGILLMYRRTAGGPLLLRIAPALVLGGALGNLLDRIRTGFVTDFIDLHWWPVFNLADSSVSIGVLLLLLASFGGDSRRRVDG